MVSQPELEEGNLQRIVEVHLRVSQSVKQQCLRFVLIDHSSPQNLITLRAYYHVPPSGTVPHERDVVNKRALVFALQEIRGSQR